MGDDAALVSSRLRKLKRHRGLDLRVEALFFLSVHWAGAGRAQPGGGKHSPQRASLRFPDGRDGPRTPRTVPQRDRSDDPPSYRRAGRLVYPQHAFGSTLCWGSPATLCGSRRAWLSETVVIPQLGQGAKLPEDRDGSAAGPIAGSRRARRPSRGSICKACADATRRERPDNPFGLMPDKPRA